MAKRTIKKLQKTMTPEEFKSFCTKIAIEYARSDGFFARSYFMKKDDISEKCFYQILEYAIVYHLVTEKDVNLMEAKALSNQRSHSEGAGNATICKYSELRRKRNMYTICLYSDKEIEDLTKEFATSELSKKEFAEKTDIAVVVLDQLLQKAIAECIVDDEIFDLIEKRSLAVNSSIRAITFFNKLRKERLLYAQKTTS